jgi:hypothetical protein
MHVSRLPADRKAKAAKISKEEHLNKPHFLRIKDDRAHKAATTRLGLLINFIVSCKRWITDRLYIYNRRIFLREHKQNIAQSQSYDRREPGFAPFAFLSYLLCVNAPLQARSSGRAQNSIYKSTKKPLSILRNPRWSLK